ncbi:MAG: hypothetical protein K6E38_09305 [Fretibacterium sp.]|nr:hypothetical protein [Fretibacterium sp.]
MIEGKRGPGRPRQYANKAAQMRAQRARMKQAGYRDIHASIPEEYKRLLDQFCASTRLSISEIICYLLGCAQERELPDVDRPIDF